MLIWRVPMDNPMRGMVPFGLMKLPFLAFADEQIENEDKVLLPLLHEIMSQAQQAEGKSVIV